MRFSMIPPIRSYLRSLGKVVAHHATTLRLHQNRKDYLFCGSDAGGLRAACFYTIIETCRMNDINPQAYLSDVIGRIADHPIHQIDALPPWRWTK